ncbi:MAG TPA: aminotransferase class I/II-fold pyridoxal phosphate-dependent enzyme [Candidatus Saccharimonadales bacterium]|nr:aminotransferase class I/II-fold pyridoxal phosphate-dependent enzyme [Candidatus Saccharimonadales bacterium]
MTQTLTQLGLNEMPFVPHEAIIQATQKACAQSNRYPEFDSHTLRQAIASHFAIPADWVAASNGSAGIIHQAMIASGQGEVAFGWPSFDAFPFMAKGLGMSVHLISLKDNACDLEAMARAITPKTSIVIICTPNTPTGGVVSHEAVVQFLKKTSKKLIVLIDEAYQEFVTDPLAVRALELVKEYPNVVMTRTFSKAYGLAGLRVGYAIAQPELAEKIMLAGVPFSIPVPAQAAAIEALAHSSHLGKRIAYINNERHHMTQQLKALKAPAVNGHGNFVWLPVGEIAEQVADILRKEGVLVKAMKSLGIRITVGTRQETNQLLQAWEKVRHLIPHASKVQTNE